MGRLILQLAAVLLAFVAVLSLVGGAAGSPEVFIWVVLLVLAFALVIRRHRRRTSH
ncbi:hypothetical protein [Streptomyces sp. 142MFCol3.1]|uniref:hypothetical protein n=1 Tax=Streptomyces sp. 142MFCol3.1 TaxID=1172179 RepID=UPI000415F12F|nr:hypothetical protein [Streptomyces sp. 142MFCol3.1]